MIGVGYEIASDKWSIGIGATHSRFSTSSDTHYPAPIITTGTDEKCNWAGLPNQNLIRVLFGSGEFG
jgi:hypothetical protein